MLAKQYQNNLEQTATHLEKSIEWVKAAFNYAEAYPEEITNAIADDLATNYTTLKRILPQIELISIPLDVLESDL